MIVVDALSVGEIKTRAAAEMLKRLGVDGKALLVDVKPEDKLALSVRNIEGVRLLPSNRISARDVMNTRRVVLTRAALEKLQEALGSGSRPDPDGAGCSDRCETQRSIMKLTDVLRRPLITEKTTVIREDGRTLVFQVATRREQDRHQAGRRAAARLEGRRACARSLAHGKMKRQGRFVGRRSDWKKAYVKLREGEKLPEFLQGA